MRQLRVVFVALVVALAALHPSPVGADDADVTESYPEQVFDHGLLVGPSTIFDADFSGNDSYKSVHRPCDRLYGYSDGVLDFFNFDCSPQSYQDLNPDPGGYAHSLGSGVQRLKVNSTATVQCCPDRSGGDAGIHRSFRALPGQVYAARALLRLESVTRQWREAFRARVTIHMYDNFRVIGECNGRLYDVRTSFDWVSTPSCTMKPETVAVRVNVRAHAKKRLSDSGVAGYGTVAVDRFIFEMRCGATQPCAERTAY